MNKRLIFIFLILLIPFIISGCTSTFTSNPEANVSDETVFSPPEEDGSIAGSWKTEADTLKENAYFYGDGKYVTFIQDPEEETWCITGLWKQDGDTYIISEQKAYKYDEANTSWPEDSNTTIGLNSCKMENDVLNGQLTLPDGNVVDTTFSRGQEDIEIPNEIDINTIVNDFLIH